MTAPSPRSWRSRCTPNGVPSSTASHWTSSPSSCSCITIVGGANPGRADGLIRAAGVAIAYDWPDGTDATAALVITLWRE